MSALHGALVGPGPRRPGRSGWLGNGRTCTSRPPWSARDGRGEEADNRHRGCPAPRARHRWRRERLARARGEAWAARLRQRQGGGCGLDPCRGRCRAGVDAAARRRRGDQAPRPAAGLARHRGANAARGELRRRRPEVDLDEVAMAIPGTDPLPDEQAERRENQARVRSALARLGDACQGAADPVVQRSRCPMPRSPRRPVRTLSGRSARRGSGAWPRCAGCWLTRRGSRTSPGSNCVSATGGNHDT